MVGLSRSPSLFRDYSVLQQHVAFWDRDGDGDIYPWDTYTGFRELGFNIIFSLMAMAIIHLGFSYPTRLGYSWVPDPWFRVYVGTIHKAKVRMSQRQAMPRCFPNRQGLTSNHIRLLS